MYLSTLRLWNFRKYGSDSGISSDPDLEVRFNNGLNLIVGENDSGKTSIIDAIKIVLGTQSYDSARVEENDFYKMKNGKRCNELKIECTFSELNIDEAAKFLEFISFDKEKNPELRVRLIASFKENRVIHRRTAGIDGLDISFDAIDLLRVTYLKPLRDAENELSPGYKSRFAQILKSHPLFYSSEDDKLKHPLENYIMDANANIESYFKEEYLNEGEGVGAGGILIKEINEALREFIGVNENGYEAKVSITNPELSKILNKLMLNLDDNKVGLGTLNQLYVAMELLLLDVKKNNGDFSMALIEEIEAHLHPQAQLRLVNYLQNMSGNQILMTTHSITLASVIKLENLIICHNNKAYDLNRQSTNLNELDYEFLQRFLDSTKANLFFSKSVMMVEGDAENLLIPTIAKLINKPLYKYGVSIVNIGNTAFLRYSNIFIRKGKSDTIGIPVAIITDLDVRPIEYYISNIAHDKKIKGIYGEYYFYEIKNLPGLNGLKFINKDDAEKNVKLKLNRKSLKGSEKSFYIERKYNYNEYIKLIQRKKEGKYEFKDIKLFTNNWTLEYNLALSCLREYLYAAIKLAIEIDTSKVRTIEEYIDEAKNDISNWINVGCSKYFIAYKIYEPLLRGEGSKAVTAQYLSKILKLNESIELMNKIKKDKYLRYIVHAIEYLAKEELANDK